MHSHPAAMLIVLACLCSSPARATSTAASALAPPPADADAERIRQLERGSQRPETIRPSVVPRPSPAMPQVPGVGERANVVPGARLLAEGTFIIEQVGRVLRLPRGEAVFAFDNDGDGVADRAVILLPSLKRESLDRLAERLGPDTPFAVTGRVFNYHGRNYLIVTRATAQRATTPEPPPANATPKAAPGDPAAAAPSTPPTPAPDPLSDPTVQDLIRSLEQDAGPAPLIDAMGAERAARAARAGSPTGPDDAGAAEQPPGNAAPNAPASPSTVLRIPGAANADDPTDEAAPFAEGRLIVSRRGRLIRATTGVWVFHFDSSASGSADLPLMLLPCATLQAMERDAMLLGDGASFVISGELYTYGSRDHLMPTMYRVERRSRDLNPIQ